MILQHIYDTILAYALLQECSILDLPQVFEDINKSLNYDYCSSENKVYYGLQQVTLLAEIFEGLYESYQQGLLFVPSYHTGYYIGEAIFGSILLVIKILKFVFQKNCEDDSSNSNLKELKGA